LGGLAVLDAHNTLSPPRLTPAGGLLRLRTAHAAPEIGHNALAGAAYAVIYLFFAVQVVSGFAMLFADGVTLRFLHGVVMWVILAFLIHHVYSAVLIDTEDHSAMVASIFTGNKRLTKEYLAAAEDTYVD
jgi:Ni/Fe-hydrogenase 1 B-type cytochrome subunit